MSRPPIAISPDRSRIVPLYLAAAALSLLLLNCTLPDSGEPTEESSRPSSRSFVIKVDSMSAPDSASTFGAILIGFHGTLGPTQCFRFSHFEANETLTRLDIKLIGDKFEAGPCDSDPLDEEDQFDNLDLNETYEANPPFGEEFFISVEQPDNTFLTHTVFFVD